MPSVVATGAGAHNVRPGVDTDAIRAALAADATAEEARDRLFALALGAGGRDNITVVVVDVDCEPGRGYVDACPACGRQDPGVITRGDAEGAIATNCCEARVQLD